VRSSDGVHKDKIQSVQWNDKEPTVLLSGSYDRTVRTFDSWAPGSCLGTVWGATSRLYAGTHGIHTVSMSPWRTD
jgi:periodic tryptophan protein 1